MGTGDGDDPRSPAHRGWGWRWTPDPRQIGDGTPIPDPRQIGDGDGDGDRGVTGGSVPSVLAQWQFGGTAATGACGGSLNGAEAGRWARPASQGA